LKYYGLGRFGSGFSPLLPLREAGKVGKCARESAIAVSQAAFGRESVLPGRAARASARRRQKP